MRLLLWTLACISLALEIEPEYATVTCGSMIKLAHTASGYRLHSHEVKYGSGSGQQSVTAYPHGNDVNSYFVVQEAFQAPKCVRGESIKCGETVRLKHPRTNMMLHSHLIARFDWLNSPISKAQEVSAYDRPDTGDNWKVECKTKFWDREKSVLLCNWFI